MLAVTRTPFSTGLLAEFITYRLSVVVYWLNILFLGVMLWISWRYAQRAGLMTDEATTEVKLATTRRIATYQAFYALAALLCIINTYVSFAFMVLVQLNAAFAIVARFQRSTRR